MDFLSPAPQYCDTNIVSAEVIPKIIIDRNHPNCPAIPTAASGVSPSCPTISVSTSEKELESRF